MNISINGRFLTQKTTGVQRFAREIVSALDQVLGEAEGSGAECDLLCPPGAAELKLKRIQQRWVGRGQGHLWEQLELPRHVRGTLLNLCNMAPLALRDQWIVVHDAAVFDAPAAYTRAYRSWYRFAHRRLARHRERIITVSAFSADRLSRHLGVEVADIAVIGNAVDHLERVTMDEAIIDRLGLRSRRFLLSVGSQNPNKNIACLLQAFRLIEDPELLLVLAGGSNSSVFGETRADADPRLVRAGYVTDAELIALFVHSCLFVFPSVYEGFGIPPLEAMRFNCAVAASAIPAVIEACGTAAAYFDPLDPSEMAKTLSSLLKDPIRLKAMREAGIERASLRDWHGQARMLLSLIQGRKYEVPAHPYS